MTSRDEARPGYWLLLLKTAAVAEIKLGLSIVAGLIVSLLLVFSVPQFRPDSIVTAELEACTPELNSALAAWTAAQTRAGRRVQIENLAPPDAQAASTTTLRISYRQLHFADFVQIWGSGDEDLPVPKATRTFCQPRGFSFDKWHLPVAISYVFMVGWYVAVLMLLPVVLRRERKQVEKRAGLNWAFVLRWGALGLTTAGGVAIVTALLSHAGIDLNGAANEDLLRDARTNGFALACIVILAPVCEETLYRGILQADFVAAAAPVAGAALIAGMFSAMHPMTAPSFAAWLIYRALLFVISLVLSWAYLRGRTVWASAIAHSVHNGVLTTLFLLQ